MSERRIGLAGIILLALAIGIWAVLPKHGGAPAVTSAVLASGDKPTDLSGNSGPIAVVASDLQKLPNGRPRTGQTVTREPAPPASDLELAGIDRDFAAAAARPYVEMYQREHPGIEVGRFDWTQFKVIYAPARDGSNAQGYIVVFFPASRSEVAGFACFQVKDEVADHLAPISWGYATDLAHGIENFRGAALEDNRGCLLSL
jgi:hypothetical protein